MINLSLVLSFRNEEHSIKPFYNDIKKLLDENKIIYEFIFVDDYSNDDSQKKILDLIKVDKSVKYIKLSRNFGIGPAIMAGLEHSSGDSVVYMDCDLQEPPELVIQMYNKFKEGYDVVHTQRTQRLGESKFKLFLTLCAYKILETLCTPKIIVNSGDFRLLSQRAKKNVLNLKERNPFIRALSIWIGFKQITIQYKRLPRKFGKTHFSLFSSLNPYKELIRGITSFSSFPLYLSFVFFIFCFAVAIFSIFINFPIIYIIQFFMFSLIFFYFGILSMYIERILEQTNSRPIYLIEEKIGFDK
jgi:glycosyltransferase involved in cell wall biosynthesis